MSASFIPNEIIEKIKSAASVEEVIADFVTMKRSGTSLVGDCPCCNGKKKLSFSPSKGIWKCFSCDAGGADAVSFLTKTQGMEYLAAVTWLADKYHVPINEQPVEKKKTRAVRNKSFRDEQLKASGIPDKVQKYYQTGGGDKSYEYDRYQKATIDKNWNVVDGDDMILRYVDLNFAPIMYQNHRGKSVPLLRVRWSNPALHKDKDGKEIRYQSPYGSGSHIWLPNQLIEAYQKGVIIQTLWIYEGEKKADKSCLHGMMAVGIMGIHNFAADGDMPHQFELIIKKCGVSNIVFVLDADYQDISIKVNKPVDLRPKTFFKAVLKFRTYFAAYANEGVYLNLFFAHGKEVVYKGIDDLLVRKLNGREAELKEDFERAMIDRKGEGAFVNVHNITSYSDYQLKEFWNLHSKPAFFKTHEEELKKIGEFIYNKLRYRWNPDESEFELCQKLLPHETFWRDITWFDKGGTERKRIEFSYRNVRFFLQNRGYFTYQTLGDKYRFIHIKDKVVREVDHNEVQDFVIDFAQEIQQYDVEELLLRGGRQYLGPDKLSKMYRREPAFNEAEKDCQFLYFKNAYWKITADEIIQRPLSDLPKYIWKDQIVDFEVKYLGAPMCQVKMKNQKFGVVPGEKMTKCDIANFFLRSSWFSWHKLQELKKDEEGVLKYVPKENPEQETKEDLELTTTNLVGKMLATGYLLHSYIDFSNTKGIIAVDGLESEVGKSEGGTGKSLWAKMFQHIVPQIVIDGKKKNLEDDNHLYERVDERTKIILFDDVRVNFPFEFLFSQITTGILVNPKGEKSYNLPPPKFIIATNHMVNGEGNSFDRRQYSISFSDYYNAFRTVYDDFGHQLFHEWDNEQWNLFYNWMATCIQVYLKYDLKYTVPQDVIRKRKLRQDIGENFLEFVSLFFHTYPDDDGQKGKMLNKRIELVYLLNKYLDKYQAERRYMNGKRFKDKFKKYAKYSGLEYNPEKMGKRIMSNSKEYIMLADDAFEATDVKRVESDFNLNDPHDTI